jgi:diacylglycerol kinase (ATP)
MNEICLLVFNPRAGKEQIETDELIAQVYQRLGTYHLELYETKGDADVEDIKQLIHDLKPTLVLVAGGDGTIRTVVPLLMHKGIPMGIIPLGSANGLAACMGIKTLEESLEALAEFEVRHIDVLEVEDEFCLHLADFGFNANLIRNFEEQETRGMLGYIKSSLSELFSTQSKSYKLEIDGVQKELFCKMLVIANGDRYGTGAVVNPLGSMEDGKFEIIALNPQGFDELLKLSFAFFNGSLLEMESVQWHICTSCSIHNLEKSVFQIDGDLIGNPSEISIKIHPKSLPVIVGKGYASS